MNKINPLPITGFLLQISSTHGFPFISGSANHKSFKDVARLKYLGSVKFTFMTKLKAD
jgi:hypothetical protein